MNHQLMVSPRERELLDKLEIIRRNNKKITVVGFCNSVGYANKSALRHFPVLKQELSLYVAQFARPGNKGSAPSAVRHLEVQVKRLNREVGQLKRELEEIPILKAQVAKQKEELKQCSDDKRRLQGMISTLIVFLSDSDLAKARDLSSRLEKHAKALLEEENSFRSENENDPPKD